MFLVIIMHDSIVASQKPSNVAPLIAYLFKKNLLNFFLEKLKENQYAPSEGFFKLCALTKWLNGEIV